MRHCRPVLFLIAALALSPLWPLRANGAEEERLSVELLTTDLGDPRAPSNLKLAVRLPDAFLRNLSTARAEDFSVHVFPDGIDPDVRDDDMNRAGGVYLWQSGQTVFLDARQVPIQDREGEATVRVSYHPDNGPIVAEGVADARCSYATQLVDVFLAVDASSSMNHTDPKRRRVVAARTFIEMAREGGGVGRVGLITFNSRARLNTPLLPLDQGETLLNELSRVGANGLTSLDAPLQMGLEQFAGEAGTDDSARPVIILLTDGRNEGSRYRDTHAQCAEAGIRLYTIGLTELADHNVLKIMAESTGGMYFRAPKDEDLPDIYARLAAELGKRRVIRSELLPQSAGDLYIPIDASLRRLVAIADEGARVRVVRPDGSFHAGGQFSGVHMVGRPAEGEWQFSWMDAAPNASAFSLSGDSPFFLDMFPPQYGPGRISIGATLAEGASPLADAEVWIEPLPGIFDDPVQLFDDGLHGDGIAGDGVYGTYADVPEYAPERMFVTVRAAGTAWEYGDFVRQASSPAVQVPDPPVEGTVRLDGDIDFGVLFPGETGTAVAAFDLEAEIPRDIYFDLLWNAPDWPGLASNMRLEPGRHGFELEIEVPSAAMPGEYTGSFSVSDHGIIRDAAHARLRVGTVRLGGTEAIDLGVVPPGTFAGRKLVIPYSADKGADVTAETNGNAALTIVNIPETIAGGEGEFSLELMVSVPLGTPDGMYESVVAIQAGPGTAAIPLRWRVEEQGAFARDDGGGLSVPDQLEPLAIDGPAESPWERASRAFRDRREPEPAIEPSTLHDFSFPEADGDVGGGSGFWSAWWMYLLAILLLLLLLLLLIVYMLYRLGKSSLARFLLVSGLANLILLAAFIALLGTASGVRSEGERLAVSLIEDEHQPNVGFSDAERGILGAASPGGAGAGGGRADDAGEIVFDGNVGESSGLPAARSLESPVAANDEAILAQANQPSVVPLENRDNEPLRRRASRNERPERELPESTLPEISEPQAEPVERTMRVEQRRESGEVRPEPESPESRGLVAWSDDERVVQPLAATEDFSVAEQAEAETVAMDREERRIDPRGRRGAARSVFESMPEPRVEIFDPDRDATASDISEMARAEQSDPGVREIRPQSSLAGESITGARPGTVLLSGGLAGLPVGSGAPSRDMGRGRSRSGSGNGESGLNEGRFDSRNGESGGGGGDSAVRRPGGGGDSAVRRPGVGGGFGRSNLGDNSTEDGFSSIAFDGGSPDWRRNARRDRQRSVSVAASSMDNDSLLIVVGDFARLPDSASEKLFNILAERLGAGLTVEDRRVAPGDATLADCLLSLLAPEEAERWSDSDIRNAADYLSGGGHIWLDASTRGQADGFMRRLADAVGGRYGPLPDDHQLAAFDAVDAVVRDGNVLAVATALDWRKDWRYGRSSNGPTLRFLIRALNYFLSGNAETGIVLEPDEISDSVQIQPYEENIPELLAGATGERNGTVWKALDIDNGSLWRMPAWSDPGSVGTVSDGQGGRALKFDLDKASKGRAAVYKTFSPPENLSNVSSITLDAYHDGTDEAALSMVFTVAGANGWTDFETRPVRLRQGWNTVAFDFDGTGFRPLAGGAGYDNALTGAGETGRAGLFFYRRAETPAVVLIRNVRLHEK